MTHLSFRKKKLFSAGKRKQPHFPRSSLCHFTRELVEGRRRENPLPPASPHPATPEESLEVGGGRKMRRFGALPPGAAAEGLFCFAFVSRTKEGGRTRGEREKKRKGSNRKRENLPFPGPAAADQTDIFPANHAGGRQPLVDSHRAALAARMKVGHERVWPHNAKTSIFLWENIPGSVLRGPTTASARVPRSHGPLISRQAPGSI